LLKQQVCLSFLFIRLHKFFIIVYWSISKYLVRKHC
jgi:hypothetical protein